MDGWQGVGAVLAFVVLVVLLAVGFTAGILVFRLFMAVFLELRRPISPRPPSPSDDRDDEEYIARHHH